MICKQCRKEISGPTMSFGLFDEGAMQQIGPYCQPCGMKQWKPKARQFGFAGLVEMEQAGT